MTREIASLLQQLSCRVYHPTLLAAIHAGRAAAVTGGRAQAHFDDQHHAAMQRHDIELTASASIIAQHDLGTRSDQMCGGQIFGLAAKTKMPSGAQPGMARRLP